MRSTFGWVAVPLIALIAASCSDANQATAPELNSELLTMSVEAEEVADGDVTTADLLAGQDILVGEVSVTHYEDGTVSIEYAMDEGFCLDEVHWEATYDGSTLTNGSGNPQIGQFEYGDDALDCATTYSEGPVDITGTPDDEYIVAAHAVVAGTGGSPNVVFGTFDDEGDGAEEGDIYGIDPTSGDLVLVADIPNDGTGDPFDPNGLAIDRGTEELFFVTELDLHKVPAENADPAAVTPTTVMTGLPGASTSNPIRSATINGDYYYYIPNGTDELWRVPTDGLTEPDSAYCTLGEPDGLFFGDIAADPDNGTIYGVARIGSGTETGEVTYFIIHLDGAEDCASTNSADFMDPGYDFQLQVAFGDDGTLYGTVAISDPSTDTGLAGQWYTLDTATGTITDTLSHTERTFTDIAGGLPVEEFEETAWADGAPFTERGSWATYMGPFTFTIDD